MWLAPAPKTQLSPCCKKSAACLRMGGVSPELKRANWNLRTGPAANALRARSIPLRPLGPSTITAVKTWNLPNITVGAAIGRPLRWAWYALRFDGKAQNIETFRAPNGRPYGGIWIAANCNFTTFSGRGAQRMLVDHPAFVTYWLAALRPALSAATRRQITISRTAEVSRSTFCLILESVIMQNDESHCLSRNFRKGSLHFGKNRV